MNIELSVVVPSIRRYHWVRFHNCIKESFSGTFEIVFVGPEASKPDELADVENVRCIQDFGSPVRCAQIGTCELKGTHTFIASDDVFCLPLAIDKVFDMIKQNNGDYKFVVAGKYREGDNPNDWKNHHDTDQYWHVNNAPVTRSKWIPDSWLIFNLSFIRTDYLIDLGGQDSQFEGQAIAVTDLGNRAQADGAKVQLANFTVAHLPHLVGDAGDHGPIVESQLQHDQPLYRKIYSNQRWHKRIRIDMDNWKSSPATWIRRFKENQGASR